MGIVNIKNNLKLLEGKINTAGKKTLAVEAEISIRKNFTAGGRGVPGLTPWKPRKGISKKQKGTKLMMVKRNLMNVTSKDTDRGIQIFTNPLARDYAKIQNDGGVIHRKAGSVKLRKIKIKKGNDTFELSRFASSKHKKFKEVKHDAYDIEIPARPFMVIPNEDKPRILTQVGNAIKQKLNL
jgi:phage gpG-like protein